MDTLKEHLMDLGHDQELVALVLKDPTNSLVEANDVNESEIERDINQNDEEEEPSSIEPLNIEGV